MRNFLIVPLLIFSLAVSAKSFNHKKRVKTKPHHSAKIVRTTMPVLQDSSSVANPDDLLSFARTLIGTPYHFASSDPDYGFDCSGFVGYVFRSFKFDVPRSSADYADYGEKVNLDDSRPGDIVLFTGTKKGTRQIGHVGIIISNGDNEIKFIHATSGKEHAVTITTMDGYYRGRFVSIRRIFKQNEQEFAALNSK